MESQNHPIIHTSEARTSPILMELATVSQYWVSSPEIILAIATLLRAIADLVRALREEEKKN